VTVDARSAQLPRPELPGEWLEYSPLITLIVVQRSAEVGGARIRIEDPIQSQFQPQHLYLLFLMARCAVALAAADFLMRCQGGARTTGVLIQFPYTAASPP